MALLSLSTGAIIGIAVGAVAVVAIIIYIVWRISTMNTLISLRNDMEEAFSTMDVHMKKRYDLIPNLVETCKGYASHERETLESVTRARNNCIAASSSNDRLAAERELESSLKVLMTRVSEAYPALKADTQFNNLTRQLEQSEHEIAQSRKYYNAKVKIVNNKIEKFPSSIVARKMRMERYAYFEVNDVSERNAPRVSFDDSPRIRL